MPKETEKILKLNINKWLNRMESLKEKFVGFNKDEPIASQPDPQSLNQDDEEEENSSSLKQCIVQ